MGRLAGGCVTCPDPTLLSRLLVPSTHLVCPEQRVQLHVALPGQLQAHDAGLTGGQQQGQQIVSDGHSTETRVHNAGQRTSRQLAQDS